MLLTTLHDKSLLVVERGISDAGESRPRYWMLETVRQYAQQRLDECGEAEAAHARHVEYYLALAEVAAPHMRAQQQSLWMARLHEEHENLVAAMNWCAQEQAPMDPQFGLRLAAATRVYWLYNEVELGCRLAVDALRRDHAATDSAARFHTLHGLAAMTMHRGRGEEALPHVRAALAIAERLGEVEWQAMALSGIGTCLSRADEEEAALHYYEQARDLARASGSVVPLASSLNNIATIEFRHGDFESAEHGFRQALHLARGRGDVRSALIFLHNLVRVLVAARKHEGAHACAVEAEILVRGVGEDVLKLELLEVSAGLASSRGEHELAARFWGAATQRYTDAGYRRPEADEAQLVQLSADSRHALGDAAFERAEAAGRTLDVEAAILELRQWLERRA
jgi:tetratricopeptide (TPR) repeat protein